jgi:hypothetical protein
MFRELAFRKFEFSDGAHAMSHTSLMHTVNIPDQCPLCGCTITPLILLPIAVETEKNAFECVANLFCQHCSKPFQAVYSLNGPAPISVAPKSIPARSFDLHIETLSPGFIKTYNQAYAAEALGLDELSGMGYRKSLEYLIKDYLISRDQDSAVSIRSEALGSCINNRINDERMKAPAKGAVWLGNDFTHYERRYEECDVEQLKRYIDATVYWILMEITSDEAAHMDHR